MKISNLIKKISVTTLLVSIVLVSFVPKLSFAATEDKCIDGHINGTGAPCIQATSTFKFPNFSDILTFAVRMIFIVGGLAALIMLLLGAFSWITSGGEKDKVQAAQQKITAAVLGVIMIAVVLAVVVTLEQVVFDRKICLGLSCPITIPALLQEATPAPRLNPNNGAL